MPDAATKKQKKPPPPPPKKAAPAPVPEPAPVVLPIAPARPDFEDYFRLIEADDIPFEEECLRNPFSIKPWLRYIEHKRQSTDRSIIFERALQALPGSYKLWKLYLDRRVAGVLTKPEDEFTGMLTKKLPVTDPEWALVNGCFERSLILCNKYPVIWLAYCNLLAHQPSITRTRRTFDRALRALPITQHPRIWTEYLRFAKRCGGETAVRVWRRYLKLEPAAAEDYVDVLLSLDPPRYAEAARVLTIFLEDPGFQSRRGKAKFQLWTELCDLVTEHAESMDVPTADNLLGPKRGSGCGRVERLRVDRVLRSGIARFSDQVGRLWCALATWYIARGEFDRAGDVYEEAMVAVGTVRDFTMVFDAYAEFEEGVIGVKVAAVERDDKEEDEDERLSQEEREDLELDLDLRLARLDRLIQRRPFLVNDVVLRQNPHNVAEWEKRAALYKERDMLEKVVETYQDAVAKIHPKKAVGKLHMLWVNFAKLYEESGDLASARKVLDRAVNVPYKKVDDLAEVWCQWAEMELRHRKPKLAIEVMGRATAPPRVTKKMPPLAQIRYQDETLPPQTRLFKSLKLWSFYVDLEEMVGTIESAKSVYERIMELKIATPQVIINCATFLEDNQYFEESYKAYERGIDLFGYPIAFDLWNIYLAKFVTRYGSSKLERARDLFEHALDKCPAKYAKVLYLLYAKLEEDHGLARRAMKVYDRATMAVSDEDRFDVFELYIGKAQSFFGMTSSREIYQKAIETLPDVKAREMCVRFAEMEGKLLEIDRARAIWSYGSQFADPRTDPNYWRLWQEFEVKHGNEETFKEMLRIKRSVQAKYNTDVGFISSQLLAQRAAAAANGGTMPSTDTSALPSSMSELEAEAIRAEAELLKEEEERRKNGSNTRVVGFVPAKAKAPDGRPVFQSSKPDIAENPDEIEIGDDDDDDSEDEDNDDGGAEEDVGAGPSGSKDDDEDESGKADMKIKRKEVPDAVFGGILKKAQEEKAAAASKDKGKGKVAPEIKEMVAGSGGDEEKKTQINKNNRLQGEKSTYLLHTANDYVDWYPWGEEAFQKATKEDKPILLSVGYSTCHWCHVMQKESFKNKEIADLMNKYFVSIKVDREERPTVDRMYMSFVTAISGSPAFPKLLKYFGEKWKTEKEDLIESGDKIMEDLQKYNGSSSGETDSSKITLSMPVKAYKSLESTFDKIQGGFGSQPKFPTPVLFHFLSRFHHLMSVSDADAVKSQPLAALLRLASRYFVDLPGGQGGDVEMIREVVGKGLETRAKESELALQMVEFTLTKIAMGGIHDHVGSGFHRYSVDKYWHVPHFEKMLYDQAQLLAAYSDVYSLTKKPLYKDVAYDIVTYVKRDLSAPQGVFYSAEDADSFPTPESKELVEGAFAVWEYNDIQNILGEDAPLFNFKYGVMVGGNVPNGSDPHGELENKNVLIERHTDAECASEHSMSEADVKAKMQECKKKLWEVRLMRPKPHLDDKIIVSWNGLMISGLARAAQAFSDPDLLATAVRAAEFLQSTLYKAETNRLIRTMRNGTPSEAAACGDDYAFLIAGLLDLYEASFDERWLKWSVKLQTAMDELLWDAKNGGYFTGPEDPAVLLRIKDDYDGAEPTTNSVAVSNLLRLDGFFGDGGESAYMTKAKAIMVGNLETLARTPRALPYMVAGVLLYLRGLRHIVVSGKLESEKAKKFLEIVRSRFHPSTIIIHATPGWLADRNSLVESIVSRGVDDGVECEIYVCEGGVCGLPIQEGAALVAALSKSA
ncbi:pre-mRNA-splicing factor syf1 [Irineochytrium annulatum]|nr:pre-mRNA-splicing factor syf1 [Irineochytrium annulatum]